MSKEELLKYLIAEIDLIMHDKDYRFENANGTWYSRESCRDLTNEEVFEELRTELRQFADLEAKLAEKEKRCEICGSKMILGELGYYCNNDELHPIYQVPNEAKSDYEKITLLKQDYDAMVEREELLRQQLTDKDKEIEKLTEELDYKNFWNDFVDLYTGNKLKTQMLHENWKDKISFAIDKLEKVKEKALHFYVNDTPKLTGFYVDVNEIENQINQLTHQHEDKGE